MNRILARIGQAAVLLLGIAVLAFLLLEPQFEGRNAHATQLQIYFHDPFLAWVYLGSIAFFAALRQAFGLLGHLAGRGAFPPWAPASFRFVRRCAFVLIGFVAIGEVVIFMQESDDRAGGVAMGLLVAFGSASVAVGASLLERRLRPAS